MPSLPELKSLLSISLPVTINMISYRLPWLTSLYFVGKHGPAALAAAALASTIANVTGLSMVVGLNSALSTLVSQAVGAGSGGNGSENAGSPTSPLVFLQRGLLIHYLVTLPIGLLWLNTPAVTHLLIKFGQPIELSDAAASYLAVLTFGLWGHTLMFTLTPFCQALSLAYLPATVAFLVSLVHVLLNVLFIDKLELGYIGAAYATATTQILGPVLLYFYAFWTKRGRRAIAGRIGGDGKDVSLFKHFVGSMRDCGGLWQYVSLAAPSLISISEWWASEIAIFWAGSTALSSTPEVCISAMTIYQSVNSSCFMFAVGCSVAVSTRVGNWLGMGESGDAKRSGMLGTMIAVVTSGGIGLLLYSLPHTILPALLTDDPAVIAATAATIPLLSCYVFADGVQVTLSGVMKGCGLQCWGAPIVLVSYWAVALPVAWYWGFHEAREVVGLVGGMTVGTWVHCLLMVVLVVRIDWKKEASKAGSRVGGGGEKVGFIKVSGEEEEEEEEGGLEMGGFSTPAEDNFFAGLHTKMTPSKDVGGYGKIEDDEDDEEELDIEALRAMGGDVGEDDLEELKNQLKMGL